ncbi:hypothetical protein AB0E69_22360 [Kribbella sp. NPDC026611]|uniref:hypothetical protein n=1 Tax=Kribbella sp. NPDC026611 TaxID=3154911 RepID=UPI0033E897FA
MAVVPGTVLNVVLVEKAAVNQCALEIEDQVAFYNFVAGRVLQQILRTADEWPGGRREVVVAFGHVRGFRHEETSAWFEKTGVKAIAAVPDRSPQTLAEHSPIHPHRMRALNAE